MVPSDAMMGRPVVTDMLLMLLTVTSLALRPIDAARVTSEVMRDEADFLPVRVRLLVTRNAISCSKAIDSFGLDLSKGLSFNQKDPRLTECGVHQAKAAAREMKGAGVDLALSGPLLRNIETAALLFPNSKVVPVPYISNPAGKENTPLPIAEQKKRLMESKVQKEGVPLLPDRLDLSWIEQEPFATEGQTKDWRLFSKFLAENLLPTYLQRLPVREVKLGLVGRWGFLKSIPEFNKQNCKRFYNGSEPKYNQVFELNYHFVTKFVFKEGKTRRILAEKTIDSLTTDSEGAWQQMQSVLSNESTQADVFRDMMPGKNLPPWDLMQGFRTFLERELRPAPNGKCRVLNKPNGVPEHFCKADVGDVCQSEIDAKKSNWRPRLRLVEDVMARQDAKAQSILEDLKLRGLNTSREYEAALETLQYYRDFRCCTDT